MGTADVLVWDRIVRCFHWSLVAAFAVAYLTGDEAVAVHVWAGYAIGGLVLLRIVWGFIGPRHARFSDFVYRPAAAFGYLLDLLQFRGKRFLGHSPAGGAMVIALLLGLAGTVGTGLVTHAIRNHAGPLAGIVATVESPPPAGTAGELPTRAAKPGRAWKGVHELFANLVLVLIGLHVTGVIVASLAHRENLVRAMITGRKRTDLH